MQCSITEFYNTRSFIAKGILPASPLVSLVLQSEQYHPVAQTHLHKDLKCILWLLLASFPGRNEG